MAENISGLDPGCYQNRRPIAKIVYDRLNKNSETLYVDPASSEIEASEHENPWAVLLIFLRLGLTSFGGPVAHLGYFRNEFVTRRKWLNEHSYADLVALCQFLPGPASSQVGMALGMARGGFGGALAAWIGFTLPSAVMLCLFAMSLSGWGSAIPTGALHGLKVVAVAVVAQAVWGMARNLCVGPAKVTIAVVSTCIVLVWGNAFGQIAVIAAAALVGIRLFKPAQDAALDPLPISVNRGLGFFFFNSVLWVADRITDLIGLCPKSHAGACHRFLSRGIFGFWRRSCCFAAATSRCRPAELGIE